MCLLPGSCTVAHRGESARGKPQIPSTCPFRDGDFSDQKSWRPQDQKQKSITCIKCGIEGHPAYGCKHSAKRRVMIKEIAERPGKCIIALCTHLYDDVDPTDKDTWPTDDMYHVDRFEQDVERYGTVVPEEHVIMSNRRLCARILRLTTV